jgi:hypothetical protein
VRSSVEEKFAYMMTCGQVSGNHPDGSDQLRKTQSQDNRATSVPRPVQYDGFSVTIVLQNSIMSVYCEA